MESPVAYCSTCRKKRPVTEFSLNHSGRYYRTCNRHRKPLASPRTAGEIDAQVSRQTRNSPVVGLTNDPRPARRTRRTKAQMRVARAAASAVNSPPVMGPPHAPTQEPTLSKPLVPVPDALRFVFRVTNPHDISRMKFLCTHCGASHFIEIKSN